MLKNNKIADDDYVASSWLEAPDFLSLIEIARKIFKTRYAYITRFNGDTLTVTSNIEFREINIPRHLTFCHKTVNLRDIYIVEDTEQNPEFRNNPYVTQYHKYRFYAGVPIFLPNGNIFGTFCIFDSEPRVLSDRQKRILRLLASQTSSLLKLHFVAKNYETIASKLTAANSAVITSDVILNTMHDGIIVQDYSGRTISFNPAAIRIFGIDEATLKKSKLQSLGWKVFDENHAPLKWDELPPRIAIKTHKLVENAIVGLEKQDGKIIWLKISSTPLFENDLSQPSKIISSFTDITETKLYSENLKKLADVAEDANQSKSAFLANVSHEIRTPLNGVVGIADALSRTILDDKQREMVELIKSAGKTLEILLNDVLDLSKIEAGQLKLESLPLNIKEVISSAALLIKFQADAKKIGFELKFAENMHLEYYGDMVRMRQIISNLASNAVKFTTNGKVTIMVEPLEVANGMDVQSGVKIIVRDTGIGIRKDDVDKLFNRYTQADNSITRRYGGTGLGLSISKDLLSLMGGSISVNSQVGIGSEFIAIVPLKRCLSENIAPEAPALPQLSNRAPSRVLLAEDHAVNQKIFEIITAPFGFETTIVANGLEAFEAYQAQEFDMIFMDMKMPLMDGLETTRAIRAYESGNNKKHTPIIMLSANNQTTHSDISHAAGADYFLGKPIELQSFIDLLHRIENDNNSAPKE